MKYFQWYKKSFKIFRRQVFSFPTSKTQGKCDIVEELMIKGFFCFSQVIDNFYSSFLPLHERVAFFSFFLLLLQLLSYFPLCSLWFHYSSIEDGESCFTRVAIRDDTTISLNASVSNIKNILYKRVYFVQELSWKFICPPVQICSYLLFLFIEEL